MAHLEAFGANTVDAWLGYAAIRSARIGAAVYTDNRANLTEALGIRDGAPVGVIDEAMTQSNVELSAQVAVITRSQGSYHSSRHDMNLL